MKKINKISIFPGATGQRGGEEDSPSKGSDPARARSGFQGLLENENPNYSFFTDHPLARVHAK